MTTIAANLECMAADQRCTSEGPICHVTKIHRIGDGLFGLAGDVMLGLVALDWLRTPKRDRERLYKMIPPEMRDSFTLLELSKDGLAMWSGWGVKMLIHQPYYAIGSGGMSAMQALKQRKTPEEAVNETFSLDECSGGVVELEYLFPPELTRKRRG